MDKLMMISMLRRRGNYVTINNVTWKLIRQQHQHRTYIQFDDPNQNFIDTSTSTSTSYPKQQQQLQKQQQQYPNQYVWQEPPGRMKKIMEMIRIQDKKYQYMHNRSFVKMKDIVRRIRISNSAMVTRLSLIKDLYEDCSAGLHQIKHKVQLLCQQHNLHEQLQQIQPRRKYHFKDKNDQYIYNNNYDDDDEEEEEEKRSYNSLHPVDTKDDVEPTNDSKN